MRNKGFNPPDTHKEVKRLRSFVPLMKELKSLL